MRELIIDEIKLEESEDAHELIASALSFPSYYGMNLSALSDCLTDIDTPTRIVIRRVPKASGRKGWLTKMEHVVTRCAEESSFLDAIVYTNDIEGETSEHDLGQGLSAEQALLRLKNGNEAFTKAHANDADISPALVERLFSQGQQPYAAIITCADSRVAPEHIFMAGLGELFCIRIAGCVVDEAALASALYAAEHLHTRLIVVMGHTHCGAIESAMEGARTGTLSALTGPIAAAIQDERDPYAASVLNTRAQVAVLRRDEALAHLNREGRVTIAAAIYHTATGVVDFL